MLMIVGEFLVVLLKVMWAFASAGARWVVRPKEKSVAGQVCLITGAGSVELQAVRPKCTSGGKTHAEIKTKAREKTRNA